MADYAVGFSLAETAGGRGLQVLLPAHQEVPGGGVAAALGAAVGVVGFVGHGGSQRCGGGQEGGVGS